MGQAIFFRNRTGKSLPEIQKEHKKQKNKALWKILYNIRDEQIHLFYPFREKRITLFNKYQTQRPFSQPTTHFLNFV